MCSDHGVDIIIVGPSLKMLVGGYVTQTFNIWRTYKQNLKIVPYYSFVIGQFDSLVLSNDQSDSQIYN